MAPAEFKIGNGGDSTSVYTCGAPRFLASSIFPDPYLDFSTNALKTWEVSCNMTEGAEKSAPKCCVSFSSYINDSIVPCPTCACGCAANPKPTSSTNATATLLPNRALTLAPANRTAQLLAWASIAHTRVPNPLPCQDNCGVSINWHVVSDYSNCWSARMSLFGWDNVTHPDWFAVVEMPTAIPGFERAYTFIAMEIPPTNTSMVVQGLEGYSNYLLGSCLVKTGVSVFAVGFLVHEKDHSPGSKSRTKMVSSQEFGSMAKSAPCLILSSPVEL